MRSESCFDQLFPHAEEQIHQLSCPFLEPGKENKLLVFVFGEIFVIRGSRASALDGVKNERTFSVEVNRFDSIFYYMQFLSR